MSVKDEKPQEDELTEAELKGISGGLLNIDPNQSTSAINKKRNTIVGTPVTGEFDNSK